MIGKKNTLQVKWFSIRWKSCLAKFGCFGKEVVLLAINQQGYQAVLCKMCYVLAFQGSYLDTNWIVTIIAACDISIQGGYQGFGYVTAKDLVQSQHCLYFGELVFKASYFCSMFDQLHCSRYCIAVFVPCGVQVWDAKENWQ